MDDFNTGEIKAIYRKLYSSENNPITQYDFQDRFESQWVVYALFCICVSVCYVFSNISATKPVYIEYIGVIITPGTFIYPFSFLIIDLLNEFYGFKLAKKAIYMSVLANALIFFMLYISVYLPSLPDWRFNESYNTLVGQVYITFFASTAAFISSEIVNSWILCKIKELTSSRYLFLRVFTSTAVASLIDSFVFCYIAFYGKISNEQIISIVVAQVAIKIIYAFLNILPAYGARYLFNRYLVENKG
jgi:uncharacterized integral membrane protein (TIGR00697 family)